MVYLKINKLIIIPIWYWNYYKLIWISIHIQLQVLLLLTFSQRFHSATWFRHGLQFICSCTMLYTFSFSLTLNNQLYSNHLRFRYSLISSDWIEQKQNKTLHSWHVYIAIHIWMTSIFPDLVDACLVSIRTIRLKN